ncbi:MAG: DUF2339 domain-containing protein [Cyanobacteria bacterium HKST-UBA03]|nr:DUF2339 domain-containing protein [Cyanobacteria bacterium HKST-UBA03]
MKWFSWLGIVCLLFGVLLAITYAVPYMSNGLKLVLFAALAGGLYGVGKRIWHRFAVLSHICVGGALAIGYMTTYATFFVDDMALIHLPVLGWACLFLYTLTALLVSLRLSSQIVAGLALTFSYVTVFQAQSEPICLLSALLLNGVAVALRSRYPEWKLLPYLAVVGAYSVGMFADNHFSVHRDVHTMLNHGYLATTGLMFLGSAFWPGNRASAGLNYSNTVFFYLAALANGFTSPQHTGTLEFVMAGTQLATVLAVSRRWVDQVNGPWVPNALTLGLLLLGLGTLQAFDGVWLGTVLAAQAAAMGVISRSRTLMHKTIYQVFALLFFGVASLDVFYEAIAKGPSWQDLLVVLFAVGCGLTLETLAFRNQIIRLALLLASMGLLWAGLVSELTRNWETVSFVVCGLLFLGLGLSVKWPRYRWAGMGWLIIAAVFFIGRDLAHLDTPYKIALYLLAGLGLLGASFVYNQLASKEGDS